MRPFPIILTYTVVAAALGAFYSGAADNARAQDWAHAKENANGPLVIHSQGSFFVGGLDKTTDALNSLSPSSGTTTANQMYVQFQIPEPLGLGEKTPVIMIHGCCLSAKSWEETPDGRMGWNEYFLRKGHATFLPEQVTRARSGFDPTILNEIALGLGGKTVKDIPYIYSESHESAFTSFRFGAVNGVPYTGEQFPVDYVDEFYKQLIPDMNDFIGVGSAPGLYVGPNPTYNNLQQLASSLSGAVIIGHSESGFFPENAALVSTQGIKGMVSLEPGGSCTTTNPETLPLTSAQIKTLSQIPTLIVFGDNLSGSWLASFANCQSYAASIKAAGGDVTLIHLPDIGIRGNSHMMMLDKNNLQVADVILNWIDSHVDRARTFGR
jgi:hypothetical protein